MKKIILFTALYLIQSIVNAQNDNFHFVIFTNASDQKIIFYKHNIINRAEMSMLQPKDSESLDCSNNIYSDHPLLIYCANHLNDYPFFVRPGNRYEFITDRMGKIGMRCLTDSANNGECNFFKKLILTTDYLDEFPFRKHLPPKTTLGDRDRFISDLEYKRLKFLESEVGKYKLTTEFKEAARAVIKSYAINDRLVWDERIFNKQKINAYYKVHLTEIDTEFAENNQLNLAPYRLALSDALQLEPELLIESKNISSINRQYLQFLRIVDASGYLGSPGQKYVGTDTGSTVTNKFLLNYLHSMHEKSLPNSKFLTKDFNGRLYRFDSLIKPQKDEIVFVDFWASWCVPCLTEIPYIKKLMGKYKNEKVRFMFFSIDKDDNAWKAKCEETGMKSSSYLLLQPEKFELANRQKISAIPMYVIFSSKNIIYNTATPGSGKLDGIFNKLLNE
ncbi:TlpA family protein disulfide reductase [Ginsengibacter hankyongi]|uniref:TlpA family protein disulfide reductase n=1 Tax=Ginsengibacter hankyongi TaxID=2607284 RepID=A0A5J5IH33_9BACT|nr:TlpA disulfide reductase family protein [Ginsengibacter hankyongi]KAA9038536.1 TlpA family protein disulfide reductase [Ginsengibacter hankyongi]